MQTIHQSLTDRLTSLNTNTVTGIRPSKVKNGIRTVPSMPRNGIRTVPSMPRNGIRTVPTMMRNGIRVTPSMTMNVIAAAVHQPVNEDSPVSLPTPNQCGIIKPSELEIWMNNQWHLYWAMLSNPHGDDEQ